MTYHGARVMVLDDLAATHYQAGDTISFIVGKEGSSQHLSFTLLDFPVGQQVAARTAP